MKTGIEIISAERKRQIEIEGWTPQHDDRYYSSNENLALAAVSYTLPPRLRYDPRGSDMPTGYNGKILWPWESKWWKPTPDDRIRELAKAGALIAAQIDVLQRKK